MLCPKASSTVPPGNRYSSTSALHPENVECPEVYEGNGGVVIGAIKFGLQNGSPTIVRIAVTGRMVQYVYLLSQHAMALSATPTLTSAIARAARGVLKFASATCCAANCAQWPGGVTVPAPSAQN